MIDFPKPKVRLYQNERPMIVTWNIVSRNIGLSAELREQLRRKLAALEADLQSFPPEKIHLQIMLERQARNARSTVALTLRLPANIIRVEKSAAEAGKAFDGALKALQDELKSSQPPGRLARRRGQSSEPDREAAVGFTPEPMAEGTGPQRLEDMVRDLFRQNYNRLLRHARRDVQHDELAGDIPKGALDPKDLVDEAARQAEAKPGQKPREMSWLVWFYHLIHEELRRRRQRLKEAAATEISAEQKQNLPEDRRLLPMDRMVKEEIEPEVIKTEDIVPNPEAVPPDQAAEENDLLEHLQEAIKTWPRLERDVFELHFVEGLGPEDIVLITHQSREQVRKLIASVHQRLREEIRAEEEFV